MDITIYPKKLTGTVQAIPSKSQAHRALICAALSDNSTSMICQDTNKDIEATVSCLNAIGANICRTSDGYHIVPIKEPVMSAQLDCGESGSTLRFMLPIVGALGIDATIIMHGRLPNRPLSPLWEEMERMGCSLSRPTASTIHCTGRLKSGTYTIDGGVSSQYITGLLLAQPLIGPDTAVEVVGTLQSESYVKLTKQVIALYKSENATIPYHSPGHISIEGDWSNGAFFVAAKKLGNAVEISGLLTSSVQGDRVCVELTEKLSNNITIDAADIPDLVPILAVTAAANQGAVFTNIARLRLKESDRVQTVISLLEALGAKAEANENTLTVHPAPFRGCEIDSHNDHRIAMSAAIAATCASGPVKIKNAQCVEKSYPLFWDVYKQLGGHYEQHVR